MDPILGQVQAFGFNFAPYGWALCNGQLLNISANSALFALLSNTFGGDGKTTFGVPDLQGRTVIGVGNGANLSPVTWGQKSGFENATIALTNMPAHSHALTGASVQTVIQTVDNTNESSDSDNGGNVLGTSGSMPSIYRESPSGTDHLGGVTSTISGTTTSVGGSAPVSIRNPFLGLYYCIATQGIFPTRD